MLTYLPQRAQVGFAADAGKPDYIRPYALDQELSEVAVRTNVLYDDVTPDFVRDRRQMDLFLRSDGHLAAAGDVVAAESIGRAVVHNIAPFKNCIISKLSSADE